MSGDRLQLRFTTSVKGSLTITGPGIHEYAKRKLRAGRHHIEIALNKRGVLDVHRHRRFKLKLRLEAAGVVRVCLGDAPGAPLVLTLSG